MIKHGMCGTRPYRIWDNMVRRCKNKNASGYKHYGGRGIMVCNKWKTFIGFWDDMNWGYGNNLTLDRINNDGNYELENCRWISLKKQSLNTSQNNYKTYKGETLTISQFAEKYPINEKTLRTRIHRGWSIEEALTLPPQKGRWQIKKFRNKKIKSC